MGVYISIKKLLFQLIIASALVSCDSWFSYSPYEGNLDRAYQGTTAKNLALINAMDAGDSKPFKVALLSDPHYHFSELDNAIAHINKNNDYAFTIVTGDLSENGLKQEFMFFYNSMRELKTPYVTIIGNHDYLSNGEKVYHQMFGDFNYSFVFNNVKFVMFDNNTLESGKEPELGWFAEELRNTHGYDHVIPFSHIPPYDVQMKYHAAIFHELNLENDIRISIHGHKHDFSIEDVYGDGVLYATVSSPQKRTYSALTISPTSVEIQKIEY